SLHTRKFFILRLTMEPFFQPETSRRAAPVPEPVSLSLLMSVLLRMLVVTMLLMPLVSWRCLPCAVHHRKFEDKRKRRRVCRPVVDDGRKRSRGYRRVRGVIFWP
ncbi:unnamed protein product, partial [Ectocarpus sp. 4 AP-2014]